MNDTVAGLWSAGKKVGKVAPPVFRFRFTSGWKGRCFRREVEMMDGIDVVKIVEHETDRVVGQTGLQAPFRRTTQTYMLRFLDDYSGGER